LDLAAQGSRDDDDGVMSPPPNTGLSSSASTSSISTWGPSSSSSGWDARDNNSRDNFAVVVRARKCAPGTELAVSIAGNMLTINREGKAHQFSYDTVYGPETKQKYVFDVLCYCMSKRESP
jgi:hypothetical protein